MKVMVTGGAGFIGSHLVDSLVDAGHEVVVIDNLSTGRTSNINKKAKFYEMDVTDESIAEIMHKERPDVLSHHAAQVNVRLSTQDPIRDIKINVVGLVNMIEAGRNHGLKKVVLASTGGAIYGEQIEYPASELNPTSPINPYGINKLTCEKYLRYYEMLYGMEWVSLRYSNVYGPRQNHSGEGGVIAIFLKQILSGEKPIINGDGNQTRDYVYVQDVIRANLAAIDGSSTGVFNVGTGVETSVNDLFTILQDAFGSKCSSTYGNPVLGEQLRSSISSKKMFDAFGWTPTYHLTHGISETIERIKITGI